MTVVVKTLCSEVDKQIGMDYKENWCGTIDQGIPYNILIAPPGLYKIRIIAKPKNGLKEETEESGYFEVK